MNTEITENIKGWLFYDAGCALCRGWTNRWHDRLVRRGFHPVPLQAAWATARLGLGGNGPLTEMRLLTSGGKIYAGADALVRITRSILWAWPFWAVAQIPGVKSLLRRAYRWLAARRNRFGCGRVTDGQARRPRHVTAAFYELP